MKIIRLYIIIIIIIIEEPWYMRFVHTENETAARIKCRFVNTPQHILGVNDWMDIYININIYIKNSCSRR